MIAVLQRVSKGTVSINGIIKDVIRDGLVVFVGVMKDDTETDVESLTKKISGFRIFNDQNQKMNLSIKEINGSILAVSQFTLCGDWKKGRRPSFFNAAHPEKGELLYELFKKELSKEGIPIKSGKFGAMMSVKLTNEGPVTFVLNSKEKYNI